MTVPAGPTTVPSGNGMKVSALAAPVERSPIATAAAAPMPATRAPRRTPLVRFSLILPLIRLVHAASTIEAADLQPRPPKLGVSASTTDTDVSSLDHRDCSQPRPPGLNAAHCQGPSSV